MMHHEKLPIVNEHDHIVGIESRAIIHREGLRHRAVHMLIFNLSGQLYLQKRSPRKDVNPGLWDSSAAGHVDIDESYEACAHRELYEELGLDTVKLELLFKLPASAETGMEFIQVYRGFHNGPFDLACEEISEAHWVDQHAIDSRVSSDDPALTETFKTIWRHYRQISETNT